MLNLQDEHREGITSTIVWLKTTGTLLPARLPRDTNSTKSISSSPQIRQIKMAGGSIFDFVYPRSEHQFYDPIVAKITHDFNPKLPGNYDH